MKEKSAFEIASDVYESGSFAEAFTLFMTLAESGDLDAMTRVASMYGNGEGVSFDFEKSVAWDKKAIQNGSIVSMSNLAITFRARGDIREAKYWFERAMDAGDNEAALALAKLYLISSHETERVKKYLHVALDGDYISESSRDEARNLLAELSTYQA